MLRSSSIKILKVQLYDDGCTIWGAEALLKMHATLPRIYAPTGDEVSNGLLC